MTRLQVRLDMRINNETVKKKVTPEKKERKKTLGNKMAFEKQEGHMAVYTGNIFVSLSVQYGTIFDTNGKSVFIVFCLLCQGTVLCLLKSV